MKHQFTLKILADDIWNNPYIMCEVCPITRALQRAGIQAKDWGDLIITHPIKHIVGETPADLKDIIRAMYAFKNEVKKEGMVHIASHVTPGNWLIPIPPADFEYVIVLDIPDNLS